jgi:hypothetical protein
MRPVAKIHTHQGSAEHCANTCCCVFEREAGPARYCPPSYRMPNEGSMGLPDIARHVIDTHFGPWFGIL